MSMHTQSVHRYDFSEICINPMHRGDLFEASIDVSLSTDINEWINLALSMASYWSKDVNLRWNRIKFKIDNIEASKDPHSSVKKIQEALFSEIMYFQTFYLGINSQKTVSVAIYKPQYNQTEDDILCTSTYLLSVCEMELYVACRDASNEGPVRYVPVTKHSRAKEMKERGLSILRKEEFDQTVSSQSVISLYLMKHLQGQVSTKNYYF